MGRIGSNKLLAKMASDFEKPDKVHTLWESEVKEKMWPLGVRDLLWVGKKTEERLIIEPYKFTKEFVDIIAYDTEAGISKVFKISRIGGVEMLGPWEHEELHVEKPIDSFRMSSQPIEHVKLKLSLRAKNLLTEEFPVTIAEIYQVKRTWFWEGAVRLL